MRLRFYQFLSFAVLAAIIGVLSSNRAFATEPQAAVVAEGAKTPPILPMVFDKSQFPMGLVLGGDVECTADGTLRFQNQQLQLCVGGVWRIVTLQP